MPYCPKMNYHDQIPSMPAVIRLATFNDVSFLQQLIARSVRGLSGGYYTPNQVESAIKYIFGVDTQLLADGTYYVAELDGTIAACGGWSRRNTLYGGDQHKDITDPLLEPTTDAARIRAFFVDPQHARKGLGRMMINLCEMAAHNYGFKKIELGATLPGVPLYKASGYKMIERLSILLPNGEIFDVVKMGKELNDTDAINLNP